MNILWNMCFRMYAKLQLCNLETRYHIYKLCGGVRGNLLFEYVHDKVVNCFNVPHARFLDCSSDTFNTHLDLGSHTLIQNMHQRTHKWGHTTHRKRHTRKCTHTIQSCRNIPVKEEISIKEAACGTKPYNSTNIVCTLYFLHVHKSIYFASTIYTVYLYIHIYAHDFSRLEHLQSNQCTSIHAISKTGGMYKRAVQETLVVSTFSLFTPWKFGHIPCFGTQLRQPTSYTSPPKKNGIQKKWRRRRWFVSSFRGGVTRFQPLFFRGLQKKGATNFTNTIIYTSILHPYYSYFLAAY